MRLYQRL